ncbi:MAG: hypothetical protein RIQ93_2875 [Verrucomicrobiota bacterium]|jgi:hypothetical protein
MAGLALATCALALTACNKADVNPEPTPVTTTPSTGAVATAPDSLRKVYGRWVREDGGYILEIRSGANGGVLDASYFNPKSIHVSRAAWHEGGGRLQVFVELNDVGYPGATYVLFHDPASNRLNGQYTQPSLQQTFEVSFVRQAKP